MLHVFIGKFLGGGEGEGLLFGDGLAGLHGGAHAVQGIDGVDGGGAGGGEGLINELDVGGEFFAIRTAKGQDALREPISGGGADGPGAAHDHISDGAGGFAEIFGADDFKFMGQQALLNEEDGIFFGVEGNGAEMRGASVNGHIHRGGEGRGRELARFGFHLADFRLDVVENGLLPEFFQIRIAREPGEIAVTELQGAFQGEGGALKLFGEGIAAGEVVKDEGIIGLQPGEAFIDFQTFL